MRQKASFVSVLLLFRISDALLIVVPLVDFWPQRRTLPVPTASAPSDSRRPRHARRALNANPVSDSDVTDSHGTRDFGMAWNPYRSYLLESPDDWAAFLNGADEQLRPDMDPFWEQIKLEARTALQEEPDAGPKLYQSILLQPSLLEAIASVVAHEIETELITAPSLKALFLELLTIDDQVCIRLDLQAAATRTPSSEMTAMDALLFHNGFHALVCYRVGHRLWQADRTALAYYMQSTVSRRYAADIHPACRMGGGTYLRAGCGVVIGETAVVGRDACILEGVTLGGTGKEAGDRHPKVGNGVIIQEGGTVLGNIPVGDGALVMAKSIVTKPVEPLAIVSGVPARVQGYRELTEAAFDDDLQRHLVDRYLHEWRTRYGSTSAQAGSTFM